MRFLIGSSLLSVVVISSTPLAISAQSQQYIYERLAPSGPLSICLFVQCEEVGRIGGSLHKQSRQDKPTDTEVETTGQREGNYEIEPGILGADTDLSSEFADFIEDFSETLQSSFSDLGVSADSASGVVLTMNSWGDLIFGRDDMFRAIAAKAGADGNISAINAVAHATASAFLAVDVGETFAVELGDLNEIFPPTFRSLGELLTTAPFDLEIILDQAGSLNLDTAKDLLNNSIGREIGLAIKAQGGSTSDIAEAMAAAFRNGELWIVIDGQIVESNKLKLP